MLIVWVDALYLDYCDYNPYGLCCLNGYLNSQYEWRMFASGEDKIAANNELLLESQENYLPYYLGIFY